MHVAWLALGGNLGPVRASMDAAVHALSQRKDCRVMARSMLYQTPPMGPAGQPDYLNAVIQLTTSLSPLALLDVLQAIELAQGRERNEHWGARTLDLDILAVDDLVMHSERLILPHPYMADRMFVLQPLCDLDASWCHPILNKSARELRALLRQNGVATLPEGIQW
ncbi:MAG: 2-amino-4-hydroxy-6-hydroxymethyldihydropteridine diphosphokinase [Zetaproteobacteria bacterium CG_4_9_14_3_um_filter_49_83]|nr:MAG: 2-amino-4-hydroxy-6-hydroxymethyldihydropteridine diphosphokinase [Zetaproteobacteria bacterium CG1_02_49_23]PIQ31487.1 MAG: 2-amino-4-hydroxy-6-hydroxymethyldihydropteridine diphosphokinase [Zetaproteobacteria bacterium CG17_big_fil_post_rev_8_21_14_2_50_50_13]PIV29806.1 MAG: 2-amino-4-hydroxy-6-hydroxymethyldihydropteridine diphosphokinase [Zetaproteobacteria bacterium CG02_land_8_20_14_3_00_50_9]PIY54634.1 MAG: 2-amino-4-hydroxy-6-hydroxymethyldihydropteridine diphosphokinase [Zetapro